MAGSMVYRLPVEAAGEPHMERFINAMRIIQQFDDVRGFSRVAGYHGDPGEHCWHHQGNPRTLRRAQ